MVKKEYEEKQKLKREKRKAKEKEKGKGKDKDAKKTEDEEDKEDEKSKDDKVRFPSHRIQLAGYSLVSQIKELSKSKDQAEVDLGPRIFTLNKYVSSNHRLPIVSHPNRPFRSCSILNSKGTSTRCESTGYAMPRSRRGTAKD